MHAIARNDVACVLQNNKKNMNEYAKVVNCGAYCSDCNRQAIHYGIEGGSFVYDCTVCQKRIPTKDVRTSPAPLENFHSIECIYHGPTNTRGSYVKLHSHRFNDSVSIAYDYAKNDIVDMAREYLLSKGYEIAGQCESKRGYMLLTRTFKSLKA